MSNKTKIEVPYIYEAQVVMPRSRKAKSIGVRDSMIIEIEDFSNKELPLAFRIGKQEIFLKGKDLWTLSYDGAYEEKPYTVNVKIAKENTENGGRNYKYSSNSISAPFIRFFRYIDRLSVEEEGYHSKTKEEVEKNCREWLSDDRLKQRKAIRNVAKSYITLNGLILEKCPEPIYTVMCFGLGNNHGGTGFFVSTIYNSAACFNALDYEEAKKHAETTAANRGDTESIPAILNGGNKIEVIMKEAVKFVSGTNY